MRRCQNMAGCAVLVGVMLLAAGCKKSNQYAPPPPPKVSVAKPVAEKITRYLEATGNTAAVRLGRSRRSGGGLRAGHQLYRRGGR